MAIIINDAFHSSLVGKPLRTQESHRDGVTFCDYVTFRDDVTFRDGENVTFALQYFLNAEADLGSKVRMLVDY